MPGIKGTPDRLEDRKSPRPVWEVRRNPSSFWRWGQHHNNKQHTTTNNSALYPLAHRVNGYDDARLDVITNRFRLSSLRTLTGFIAL